ncbi:MAG: AraC family transcriptional regulator [bacterium]|nr:AraC family transcriptional regulator [bacterium]
MGFKCDSGQLNQSEELAQLVSKQVHEDGLFPTQCPGLVVSRTSVPMQRTPMPYQPSLCIVVQGQKRIFVGPDTYTYNPLNHLIVPLAMPLEMEISQASATNPMLGLGLELDLKMIADLLISMDEPIPDEEAAMKCPKAIFVSPTTSHIQDGLIRLLKLLDNPTDLRVLGPAITKEIFYRLLQSEQGGHLRQLVQSGSNGHRIAGLVRFLNANFGEKLTIEDIATQAGMSPSSLHQKFRDVTGLSPLQYLKRIRLHNARAAMVEKGLNAREAGYRVGYGNPSQFSREFKRMFGVPPGQMVKNLLD